MRVFERITTGAVRITRLIGEIRRDPFAGVGNPEPLKGDLSGYWSRRIGDERRLIYSADDKEVKILKAGITTATDQIAGSARNRPCLTRASSAGLP